MLSEMIWYDPEIDPPIDFSAFDIVDEDKFNSSGFITLSPRKGGTLHISKGAIEALDNPMYGLLLFHPQKHILLLMGTNTKTKYCIKLHDQACKGSGISLPCGPLLNKLNDIMDWNWNSEETLLFEGVYEPCTEQSDDPVLVFDLSLPLKYMKK